MRIAIHPQKVLEFIASRLLIGLLILPLIFLTSQIPQFLLTAEAVAPVSSHLSAQPATETRRGDRVTFTLRTDAPRNFYALAASPQDHGLMFRDTPLLLGDPVYLVASGQIQTGQLEVTLQIPIPLTLSEGTYYLQGVFADNPSFENNVSLTNGISMEVRGTIPDFETIIPLPTFAFGVAVNPRTHEAVIDLFSHALIVNLLTRELSELFRVFTSAHDISGFAIDIELARGIFTGRFPPVTGGGGGVPPRISIVDLNTRTILNLFDEQIDFQTSIPLNLVAIHQSLHKAVMASTPNTLILFLNLLTNEKSRARLSDPPVDLAPDERSGSMFFSHDNMPFVTELSLITERVLRTIDVGVVGGRIAVSNRLNMLYVASRENNILKSFDLDTGALIAQATFPDFGRVDIINLAINDNAGIGAVALIATSGCPSIFPGPILQPSIKAVSHTGTAGSGVLLPPPPGPPPSPPLLPPFPPGTIEGAIGGQCFQNLILFDLNSLNFLNQLPLREEPRQIAFDGPLNILVISNPFSRPSSLTIIPIVR